RELDLPGERVYLQTLAQVIALQAVAEMAGTVVRYIKPHGALYNMACRGDDMARPVVRVAVELNLAVMGLPGSRLEALCAGKCPFVSEGFADRRYQPDGSLVPRSRPDAFVEEPAEAVGQAEWLIRERSVRTLCVHGDNPQALAFVRALRQA